MTKKDCSVIGCKDKARGNKDLCNKHRLRLQRKGSLELKERGREYHGKTATTEYSSWQNMKDRCSNANYGYYHRYGGRGISICDRWIDSFENFLSDMGEKPSNKHSIDRINNGGNYEPSLGAAYIALTSIA